jgi:hypothetical protein
MMPPDAAAAQIFGDTVITSLITGGIIGGLILWRSNAVNAARFDDFKAAYKEMREEEREQRHEDLAGLKQSLDGMGSRVSTLTEYVTLVRGVMTGVDGKNGIRSEVRDLRVRVAAIDTRVTRVEMTTGETTRRVDGMDRNDR